jgi:hypothetical protein
VTGRSIAISLLAHAVVLALLLGRGEERREAVEEVAAEEIEIVELPVPPPARVELATVPSFDSTRASRGSRSGRAGGTKPAPRGRLVIEPEVRSGDRGGDGSGSGDGSGDGGGDGIGSGIGGAGPPPLALSEAPKAPSRRAAPRSKARPARLIFPKKHREAEDGDVFVALLTVDDDGLVVGVRMKQGIGGRRDEVAAREVWRFRYDPARDDAGKPVRSKVEQRFMLDR